MYSHHPYNFINPVPTYHLEGPWPHLLPRCLLVLPRPTVLAFLMILDYTEQVLDSISLHLRFLPRLLFTWMATWLIPSLPSSLHSDVISLQGLSCVAYWKWMDPIIFFLPCFFFFPALTSFWYTIKQSNKYLFCYHFCLSSLDTSSIETRIFV